MNSLVNNVNNSDIKCVPFHTGQPTRRGVQKSDQNPHHPSKGGVKRTRTVLTRVFSYAC